MKKLILALVMIFGLCGGLFAEPLEFVCSAEQGLYEVVYYESYAEGAYFIVFTDEYGTEDFLDLLQLTFPYRSKPRYKAIDEYPIELQHFLENHGIVFLRLTCGAFSVMGIYDENIIGEVEYYFGEE